MKPIYPNINIPMVGEDGNAFAILGRVKRIMRRAGLSDEEWEGFRIEATCADYGQLLRTVMLWFSVDGDMHKPCDECGTPVKADIHAEELGMCIPCSNEYYDHSEEESE